MLTPRWIRRAMLANIVVVAVAFYVSVTATSGSGPPSMGGMPVVLVLLPSVVLGFWLPRQGARIGITLHAEGLALRSEGKPQANPLANVDSIRWDADPPTLVLDESREIPLPSWLSSDPRARAGLERHVNRPS